jgi:hypothetical protein
MVNENFAVKHLIDDWNFQRTTHQKINLCYEWGYKLEIPSFWSGRLKIAK